MFKFWNKFWNIINNILDVGVEKTSDWKNEALAEAEASKQKHQDLVSSKD